MVKTFNKVAGIVLLLAGLAGFAVPNLLGMHLTPMHNIIHLLTAAIAVGSKFVIRRPGGHLWNPTNFALAVMLAAVGLYASLAFAIRQRTAEIGVRISLGATPGGIARMVLRQGSWLVAIGLGLGLAGSLVFVLSIQALLFGVAPIDPLTFAAAAIVIVVAGLFGSLLPALRAARVDPVVALRTE